VEPGFYWFPKGEAKVIVSEWGQRPNLETVQKYSKEQLDDEKIKVTTQVNQFKHQNVKMLNE